MLCEISFARDIPETAGLAIYSTQILVGRTVRARYDISLILLPSALLDVSVWRICPVTWSVTMTCGPDSVMLVFARDNASGGAPASSAQADIMDCLCG